MVGVARSRGCTTCRRRKIKCDLTQPSCQNCMKSRRRCEGYDRFPVFVNRTTSGVIQRVFLEETKTKVGRMSTRDPDTLASNTEVLDISAFSASGLPIPAAPSHHSAWEMQIVAWFWESYAPFTKSPSVDTPLARWLRHAIEIPLPTPPLKQALIALATTRYGRVYGNEDAATKGQQLYGKALVLLQHALYDQQLMDSDETLASVRAMVLYELFESTSNDPTAWFRHLSGITCLMQSRGPHKHCFPMSKAILEDMRYAEMLKALMLRKASLFGEQKWRDLPWEGQVKSPEQQLFDLGFHLAALLEKADEVDKSTSQDLVLNDLIKLLESCNVLYESLDTLFRQEFQPFLLSKSMYWSRARFENETLPDISDPADLSQLMLILNLWALQLLLSFVINALIGKIYLASSFLAPSPMGKLKPLCSTGLRYSNDRARFDLALAILRFLPLCMNEGVSEFLASRTIYPITCIMWEFRHSEVEFRQTEELMRRLSQKRKIRFTTGRKYQVNPYIPRIVPYDWGFIGSSEYGRRPQRGET